MAKSLKFTVTVDDEASKALMQGYRLFPEILHAGLFQAGAHVLAEVETRTPVDLSTLRNSEQLQVKVHGGDAYALVSTNMEYAPTVEAGRTPGKPPPPSSALLPWVKRHPAPSTPLTGTGRRSNRKPMTDESRAFLIARAIGRRGTKGIHMFEKGLQASEGAIRTIMAQTVRLIAKACGGD